MKNGESISSKFISKINNKLRLFDKNQFLYLILHRLPCDILMELNIDYACSSWCPKFDVKITNTPKLLIQLTEPF